MHTRWKRWMKSTATRRLAAAAAVLVAAVWASGCQTTPRAEPKPVAVGIPPQVAQKVDDAQAAFVDAVGALGTNYDQAVCAEDSQMTEQQSSRQAMAEANLEVAQAVVAAKSAARARGGGPPADDQGIILIEEEPPAERDRGSWSCMQAQSQPACLHAASSAVAAQIWRTHIEPYDLNPVTAADVMEAFAADIQWADQYLAAQQVRSEAYADLVGACRDGQSPLARFFARAQALDDVALRRDLSRVRQGLVGDQRGVCAALPQFYGQVLDELAADLGRRSRTGRCTAPQWQPDFDQ